MFVFYLPAKLIIFLPALVSSLFDENRNDRTLPLEQRAVAERNQDKTIFLLIVKSSSDKKCFTLLEVKLLLDLSDRQGKGVFRGFVLIEFLESLLSSK